MNPDLWFWITIAFLVLALVMETIALIELHHFSPLIR